MKFKSIWDAPLFLSVTSAALLSVASSAESASTMSTQSSTTESVTTAPAITKAVSTDAVDTATLLKKINELKTQVNQLVYKQKKAEDKFENITQVEDAKIGVLQASQVSKFPEGYFAIPGTNSAILLGGRIKADAAYYPGNSADSRDASFDATFIPLKNYDPVATKSGVTSFSAAYSRLEAKSITNTSAGDITGWIQIDFHGNTSSTSSTSYTPRLRHAIVEWNGWTIGQTLTNFQDSDSEPNTLDNDGLVSTLRRLTVRYTAKFDGGFFSFGAERPNTIYTTYAGGTNDNAANGKYGMPDLTARLRFENKKSWISFRAIARKLEVNVLPGDLIGGSSASSTVLYANSAFASKRTGWGLGTSFKLMTNELSHLYGQANFGSGINDFLTYESLPAAYLQVPIKSSSTSPLPSGYVGGNATSAARFTTSRFDLSKGFSAVLGYEWWWNEKFRTNVAGSVAYLKHSSYAPIGAGSPVSALYTTGPQVNSKLKKFLVNALYSPIKSVTLGVEVIYGTRETIGGSDITSSGSKVNYAGGFGKSTQIIGSFIYKF